MRRSQSAATVNVDEGSSRKKAESVSTLKIELPPDEVSEGMGHDCQQFCAVRENSRLSRQSAAGGDRDKRFRKEIQDEVTKKLVSKSYRAAIEQKKLRVASLTNLEEVHFAKTNRCGSRATVVTAPEFKLAQLQKYSSRIAGHKSNGGRDRRDAWNVCAIKRRTLSMFLSAPRRWKILS